MGNYSILENNGTIMIHAEHPTIPDYTICMMVLDSANEWEDAKSSTQEINCKDCLKIIGESIKISDKILSDRIKKKKAETKALEDKKEKELKFEFESSMKDARKINISGHMISMNHIASYLDFINGGCSRTNIINYENKRCELHQILFLEAGEDRTSDRESDFCQALDSLICEALTCPRCRLSGDREGFCPQCGRHIGFKQIKINLNRISNEYQTKPFTN